MQQRKALMEFSQSEGHKFAANSTDEVNENEYEMTFLSKCIKGVNICCGMEQWNARVQSRPTNSALLSL